MLMSPWICSILLFYSLTIFGVIADKTIDLTKKPPFWKKAETARWLVHENIWGTLSTTSVHLKGQAWGQPKSFSDGTQANSTGNLYFYDSAMDISVQDTLANSNVSFAITMAQQGYCPPDLRDPEEPTCARVSISGQFLLVQDTNEANEAKTYLFDRHPTMKTWPDDHEFQVYKLTIEEIWLIDIYGGASIVDINDYYAVTLTK